MPDVTPGSMTGKLQFWATAWIWFQVVSSSGMPSRSRLTRDRCSGSPGMRISPSGVTVAALFTQAVKSAMSWSNSFRTEAARDR